MKGITRRNFLKGSIAAGTAFAFTSSPYSKVRGANDAIRVAVAGIHGRGGSHISAFHSMEGVRVVALCDADRKVLEGRAGAFHKRNEKVDTYVDIRKLLDDKSIDVVSIATTNHWHSLMTIWACQAGKDVYVEKPCSHNVFEGRQCVRAARKYKRIVQHGTQRRSGGHWRTLRDIASGKRGKLLVVRGGKLNGRSSIGFKPVEEPPEHIDFDLWLGPAPKQPYHKNLVHYNWHWFWDFGNGDIGNRGVHAMDMCRWMIPNATLPKSVISIGGRFVWKDQAETPNLQLVVYDFGRTKLIYEVSNLKTKGGRPGTVFDDTVPVEPIEITSPPDVKNPTAERGPGGEIFKNFIACVCSRRSEDLDAHILEGHYSSALCHLPNISYRLGEQVSFAKKPKELGDDEDVDKSFQWFVETVKNNGVDIKKSTYCLGRKLRLDTKKEKFIGDPEADKLLTREYRKPFVVPQQV